MKISLRRDLGGFALDKLQSAGVDGVTFDKPFLLLTGPNGSGKSALMRAIRASIGLHGERGGKTNLEFQRRLSPAACTDPEKLATHIERWGKEEPADYVPAVLSIADLGWKGQPTYYFDARAASNMNKANELDDDLRYHLSLIAGGASKVSHGQFVAKTWWEAIEWGLGLAEIADPMAHIRPDSPLSFVRDAALASAEPSTERWLFIDEPEMALDSEAQILGLSVLLKAAEIGKLRVICASHSLLFPMGLINHPKVQNLDLGGEAPWARTQEVAMRIAGDMRKLDIVGTDLIAKIEAGKQAQKAPAARSRARAKGQNRRNKPPL